MAKKRNSKKRRRSKHPSSSLPLKQKISSGCFIDFEGFGRNEYRTSPPPVLIGMYRNDKFEQVVFTAAYSWAAKDSGVAHTVSFCEGRDAFLKGLADSAGVSKPLFAYSEHELRVIEKCVRHKITKRYRNVRSISARWLNRQGDAYPTPQTLALVDVSESMGISLRFKLPEGGVTSRLREVRAWSSSQTKWAEAPREIREMWREILNHNRSDVLGIRDMMFYMRQIEDE